MKSKLTFKKLMETKFIRKTEDKHITVPRGSDEVTVDVGDTVITGKPENIMLFLQEMSKMTPNG